MKKGIGPQGLGSPAKMYNSPVKQTNTDELGRKGSFNPMTKSTKGSRKDRSEIDASYPKNYQNKIVGKYDRSGGYSKKIGYQEDGARRNHKYDSVMGLRAEAYKARENNFGVKKPKVNIK